MYAPIVSGRRLASLVVVALLTALATGFAPAPVAYAQAVYSFSGITPGAHVVNIPAGAHVTAEASGEPTCTADTSLRVYDPGAVLVTSNDDGGAGCSGLDSYVEFVATTAGNYTFDVVDYGDGNYPYTLTITVGEAPPSCTTYDFSGSAPGEHVVNIPAGAWVTADASGEPTCELNTDLHVYDPGGVEVAYSGDTFGAACEGHDSHVQFVASTAGNYTFDVSGYWGTNYPYTLTVTVCTGGPGRCLARVEFTSADPAPVTGELRFYTYFGQLLRPEGRLVGAISVVAGERTVGVVTVDCGLHVRAWLFDHDGEAVGLVPSQYENGDGVFEFGVDEYGADRGGAGYYGTYANIFPPAAPLETE